jgi:cytochrome P450
LLIQKDEDNYENANEFKPFRFYDEKTNTVSARAATASDKFLAYGTGSQMCPGRYLGIRMTHILFAKILMRYDVEFEAGQTERPPNMVRPGQLLPPYTAKMVVKMRK